MKLFNKTIDRQLFKQYSLGSDLSKQEVVVKIFNPQGAQSWYILNSDPQDPDYLWAIVDLGYGAEIGSVSRNDLESYRGRFGLGFERDLGFDPINAEELYKGLRQGNFYANGGKISKGNKYGDWTITQYVPLEYDDLGGIDGGIIKLVNQDTIDELIIFNDRALRGNSWFISYNGVQIKDKNPKVVIEKLLKIANKKYAKGGGVDDFSDLYGQEVMALKNAKNQAKKTGYDYLVYVNKEGEISLARKNEFERFFDKDECKILYTIDEKGNANKMKSYADGGEVSFIDYKDSEIMYEPHYKKYYANDVEFDSLEEAQDFLDSGEVSADIRDAYSRGLFADGGLTSITKNSLPNEEVLYNFKKIGLDGKVEKESVGFIFFNKHLGGIPIFVNNQNDDFDYKELHKTGFTHYQKEYADGGEVKDLIRERNELLNDMYNNEDTEVESSDIVKVGDVLYGDDVNGYVRIVKEVNDPLKGDYFVLQDRFDNKFAFYITQIIRDLYKKELKIQNVNISEKDFLYSDEVVNIKKELEFHKGIVSLYKKNPNDASNYSGINYTDYLSSQSKIKKLEEDLKLYLKDEKHNFADGGELADFSDNQRMIMNQNVQLEHHHEELEDILEDKVPVPAWVVAKMATATDSVSDVTHYLDGQKELMEDEDEEDNEEIEDEDEDEEEDEDEILNKEVVEPINVSAGTKAEMTKNFTDNALGNLKGFLKGMEGVELRDDYTFDYKDEQYEIEPIINSDENGVSNAVFTIFDGDGEEVGEVAYSREGGKQKFTANSEFFSWNNTKFEDGGFMNGVYADGGYFDGTIPKVSTYMSNYADGGNTAINNLNKNTDIRENMISYIVNMKSTSRMSDKQYDALEKRISQKSFAQLKKEYDDLKGNASYAKGGEVENYRTLSFKTKAIAEKNKKDIESYFSERVLNSTIGRGVDERGNDGFFVEYNLKKENYAKGGEIAKAEVFGLKRNVMGTTDIEMKITGMRKAQDFIVYPIGKDDAGNVITIQSDTRIGQINLVKGVGVMSQSHSSGAYFVHLQMDKLTSFTMSESDLENIKAFINKTAGSNVGTRGVVTDNAGASRIFADGGFMADVYADGGQVRVGDKYKNEWTDSKNNSGYDIIEIKKQNVTSGKDFKTKVMITEVVQSSLPERIGMKQEEYKPNFKKLIELGLYRPLHERMNLMEREYAKGGITYYKNENERLSRPKSDMEEKVFEKVKNQINSELFVGNFGWRIDNRKQANMAYGYLYSLDDFDKNLIKNLKLKQGEEVFRYVTRVTAISGMMPFIKINIEKALLYFPMLNDSDDIVFETRGVTPLWISLIEGSFADGGGLENDGYNLKDINGKKIEVGDRVKTTQPSGGVMNPANPETGIVEKTKDAFGNDALQIRYRKSGKNYDQLILLNGKINEIIDKSSSSPSDLKKYILKADIKTVTVKRNGKEVTYKGADVLNGANVLAEGGDISSKANYIPKRDVVGVELKDGTTVQPVNGYWVKKGAEPITSRKIYTSKDLNKIGSEIYIFAPAIKGYGETGFPDRNFVLKYDTKNFQFDIYQDGVKKASLRDKEILNNLNNGSYILLDKPTPSSSAESGTKIDTAEIRKDPRGNWRAETFIEDFDGYDWKITTIKTYSGQLLTSAQGGKTMDSGSKGISMFKYTMYEDPHHTLEVSKPKRLTEKVVSEQHDKGLAKFKKFMETGMFKGGGKISNFDKLSAKVAKQYEGKPVKNQYQEEYGKFYSKEEAREVGDKVAGKVKAMQGDSKAFGGLFSGVKKMTTPSQKYPNLEGKQVSLKTGKFVEVFTQSGSKLSVIEVGKIGSGVKPYTIDISEVDEKSFKMGGETEIKKSNRGREKFKQANELAKKIRMDGESWLDAKKRAFAQLKK